MMKVRIILLCAVLLLTGCSVVRLDNQDLYEIITMIISEDTNISNTHFNGYRYYLPRTMRLMNRDEFNMTLLDKHNNRYFMYVDLISFYHNVIRDFEENEEAYFSRMLISGDRFGYLEINKYQGRYFIEAMFNYAKIEVLVSREHLSHAVANIFAILNSIDFNRVILASVVGDNILDYNEEAFDIFATRRRGSGNENFLRYIDEFDYFESNSVRFQSEDSIQIDQ